MYVNIKEIILEARALDRRIDAINKGIIPINGSNWNADRKNPNKVNKALDLSDKIKRVDNTITKYGGISPHKEYSGIIKDGEIIPKIIGNRNNVEGVNGNITFHKHPNKLNIKKTDKFYQEYFKNRPISTPSGKPNGKHIGFHGMFNTGDYGSSGMQALDNKNKKHTEYIFSPNTKSNTISQINTTLKNEESNSNQKTSYFSKKANKYYDLNGNLKSGANEFTNSANFFSKDNIPNFSLLNNIKRLKDFKNNERKSLHTENNIDKERLINKDNKFINFPEDTTLALKELKDRDNLVRNKIRKDPINFDKVNEFHDWAGSLANSPSFINRPYKNMDKNELTNKQVLL